MISSASNTTHLRWCWCLLLSWSVALEVEGQKFEPYQLNGGLVSAVAGRDFCVVASDTRLTDGGYEIYSRSFLTTRLWSVDSEDGYGDGHGNKDSNIGDSEDVHTNMKIIREDGSLVIPQRGQILQRDSNTIRETTSMSSSSSIWVASAGCSADCDALKRQVRSDIRAAKFWGTTLDVNHVATLLGQTLYLRRGFPFYSFCVVAGILPDHEGGGGAVYGYDAIGSFEQIAVATAGTGRELLQPILDRLFGAYSTSTRSSTLEQIQTGASTDTVAAGSKLFQIPKAVQTQVECTADEAVALLIRGYRSVAERDIGVGDKMVICVTQHCKDGPSVHNRLKVLEVPLKQH
mmetsp:Transcript_4960/g.7521  ORF Transcript_4960/g.7521 Transcript_4960/m.7521 type:complete len:347 (-) Transcript_4960:408-1448(-)